MIRIILIIAGLLSLFSVQTALACGGFFCQFLPVNQAGEQILFRQESDQITTMVRILYTGEAENFGWVLPVPGTPELSIGSDTTFIELEQLTRPRFILERTGEACPIAIDDSSGSVIGALEDNNENDSVTIEQTLTVGPFDAQIISSEDSQALALWLADNNFDLSDRGVELLQPYIDANMKFVVLNLQSDRDVGDIQPIILKYNSEQPVIPLRLTAVAAEDDMGILVWLLGESRAVPDNFLHVTPNYTRLNWYTGSNNAYVSYQNLITAAMDEAGGQGFATDYAGRFENLVDNLTSPQAFTDLLASLELVSAAEFVQALWTGVFDPAVSGAISSLLPLPDGQSANLYTDAVAIATQFTEQQLTNARSELEDIMQNQLIEPLQNAMDILDDDLYLTRLYTTLSADEMLTDPSFVFNSDLPNQALERNASLQANCTDRGTEWILTLGAGTGRDDVVVIDGRGQPPITVPNLDQGASWQIAQTSAQGSPDIKEETDFAVAKVGAFENSESDNGGSGAISWPLFALLALGLLRLLRPSLTSRSYR